MCVKYSIVVPIYNVARYLEKCVDSILNQTYENFEVILVDDGSTDKSSYMCDAFAKKDTRIIVIHKKNGGLVSARKAGAEVAKGEYIICVDGDDWIDNSYLEVFESCINKKKPDIVCCGYYLAYDDGRNIEMNMPMPHGYLADRELIKNIYPYLIEDKANKYFPPSLWAKAYKRELYVTNQMSVPNNISIGEDHACTKPCIRQAKSMYVLDDCLYYYRQNQASMTKNKKAFRWDGPKMIGQHFEKNIDLNEYDFQNQVYRSVVHNLYNVAASQFNRNEPYAVIKKDIVKQLGDEYYDKAINNSIFKWNSKGNLARIIMKHRLYIVMYLYNKIGR